MSTRLFKRLEDIETQLGISGADTFAGDKTFTGIIKYSQATPAAAGSSASDATALTKQVNLVTAADGTKGVALPAAAAQIPIFIVNTVDSASLKVYPVNGGNDNINALAEDAAYILGPGQAAWFIATSTTQWYVNESAGILATPDEIEALADASSRVVVSTDAGTLALTKASHANKIVNFNDADGAISLPAATGTGDIYEVWFGTACTAAAITVAASTDDEFIGFCSAVDTDDDSSLNYPALAADNFDTITLAGATTGGNVGDWFRFTDVGSGIWKLEGHVTQSGGSEATPLSDGSITA